MPQRLGDTEALFGARVMKILLPLVAFASSNASVMIRTLSSSSSLPKAGNEAMLDVPGG